jgi:hypothetical protein
MTRKPPLLSRLRPSAGELRATWGRQAYGDGDVCYVWGDGVDRGDHGLLHRWLSLGHFDHATNQISPSFIEELIARGYDISTLRFSIRKRSTETEGSWVRRS